PERRERCTPEAPQDVRVAPFALGATRPQLAAHEQLIAFERGEDTGDVTAEPAGRVVGRERATAARVAENELAERIGAALEEDVGQAGGRHRADGVAVAACVLACEQRLLAAQPNGDRPTLSQQRLGESRVVFAV